MKNGVVCNVTRREKGTFSSRLLKIKGRRTLDHRLMYTTRKNGEWNISEKDMNQVYFFLLAIASNFVSSP